MEAAQLTWIKVPQRHPCLTESIVSSRSFAMGVLDRIDRHADLVDRMADTVGVNLVEAAQRGEIAEGTLRSAVFSCIGCTEPLACKDWLDAHPDGAHETPEYCRNKALFDRLTDN